MQLGAVTKTASTKSTTMPNSIMEFTTNLFTVPKMKRSKRKEVVIMRVVSNCYPVTALDINKKLVLTVCRSLARNKSIQASQQREKH